ncbi:MAG: hypothetical protein U0984_12660 [Prosthecobacter sp.]|nr:hypothetical protein [Prosthecobacter sp.]
MAMSGDRDQRGILVIEGTDVTDHRLSEEWQIIQAILKPKVLDRLALVIRRSGLSDQVFGRLLEQDANGIERVVAYERTQVVQSSKAPGEAFFEVLRVLLIRWFRKMDPVMLKHLSKLSGYSYPTVAEALERLEPHLKRYSDRRVELRSFPRDAWFQLVAQSEKVRSSEGYADRSGQPRPVEIMQQRLGKYDLKGLGLEGAVAVGGVLGARHYEPGLDIIGAPRLDLVIHLKTWNQGSIHDLLRHLDPALQPAERGEPCQVVIHKLYRWDSLFYREVSLFDVGPYSEYSPTGNQWADEVECALDLHEMHLEAQAMEFIDRLVQKATAA